MPSMDGEAISKTQEPQGFERTLLHAFEIWFTPEIERRRANGTITTDFRLQRAQVLFADDQRPIIRLNEEVAGYFTVRVSKAVKKDDPVYADEIESFETMTLVEEERDFGHFTIIQHRGGWQLHFDFRRNKSHALDLISKAEKFVLTGEYCLSKGLFDPFVDNMFNAYELLAKARLITSVLSRDTSTHGPIHATLNKWRKLGNVAHDFVELFNTLTKTRPTARYANTAISELPWGSEALKIAQKEIAALRESYSFDLHRQRSVPTAPSSAAPEKTAMPDLNAELRSAREYVQERYGSPDPSWKADARNNDQADNAFTDTTKHANERLAVVFVKAMDDEDTRKHDSTHESTHLLNPVPRSEISYLEEAAAIVISMDRQDYVNSARLRARKLQEMQQPHNAAYLGAYNDLSSLLKIQNNPGDFIKSLRGPERRSLSSDIKPEDILKLVPGVDDIAERLCKKFYSS